MRNFNFFAIPFLIGFVFWFVVFLFLPKFPVYYIKADKEYDFYNINLAKIFFHFNKSIKKITPPVYSLKNIKLKAVYNDANGGFVIIEDKGKTHFIDLNQTYKGYRLIKINPKSAIFNKNDINYKIAFEKLKFKNIQNVNTQNNLHLKIEKKVFNTYKNNLLKIWKNIGIIKIKNGYKITFIKHNSIFEKIGLKKGDILLEVNGRKLNNDRDAWNLYKNADKFTQFEIKIKRNNQIKVLYYEVD